jgi:transcription antitermination factor NusG
MVEGLLNSDCVSEQFNFGCVFCATGREDNVAGYIRQRYPQIEALPVAQMKHNSSNGKRSHTRHIMLRGYIFLRTKESILPIEFTRIPGVLRILCEEGREWWLNHENRAFAMWVYNCGGLIEISNAYIEGETMRIVDGPIREKQGSILKVDKRNRNCLVDLRFNDTSLRVWMAFEYINPASSVRNLRLTKPHL